MAFSRQLTSVMVFAVGGLAGAGLATWLVSSTEREEPAEPGAAHEVVIADRVGESSPLRLPTARPRPGVGLAASDADADADVIPDTLLPLRLLGTLVADPTNLSQAVVLDVEEVRHMVVREGDALALHPGVTIHAIEQRRILLATEHGIEKLWLSRGEGLPDVAADRDVTRFAKSAPREKPLRSSAELRRNRSANVSPEVIDAMNQLAAHLANDLEPLYDASGRIEGVRAVSIAGEGLLDQAGISRDEVIRGVNGIEITTVEGASRVLRDLASCEPVMGMVAGPTGNREVEIDVALLKQFGCVEAR